MNWKSSGIFVGNFRKIFLVNFKINCCELNLQNVFQKWQKILELNLIELIVVQSICKKISIDLSQKISVIEDIWNHHITSKFMSCPYKFSQNGNKLASRSLFARQKNIHHTFACQYLKWWNESSTNFAKLIYRHVRCW